MGAASDFASDFRGHVKVRYNLPRSIKQSNLSHQVLAYDGSPLKKKTQNRHFPRPRGTDIYVVSKSVNAALATVALGLWLAVRLQFPHTFHLRERCSCDTTGPPDVKTYVG